MSLRFERGVASALAANSSSALKQWNAVPLEDPEVTAARQSVERIRTQLSRRVAERTALLAALLQRARVVTIDSAEERRERAGAVEGELAPRAPRAARRR